MSKIFIEESSLTAIGDAIRSKTGGTDLLSPAGMVGAIESISAGSELPVQLLTDSLDSVFKNNRFNTLVEAGCFETKNITALSSFCDRSTTLKKIDFDINCAENSVTYCYSMLKDCYKLEEIPKFVNLNPYNLNNSFYNCMYLIEIPEEKFVNFSRHSSASDLSMYRTFYHCYSLRKMPYIAKIYYDNATKTSSNVYEEAFCGCASLDEIVDLSVCLSTDTPITGSYGF